MRNRELRQELTKLIDKIELSDAHIQLALSNNTILKNEAITLLRKLGITQKEKKDEILRAKVRAMAVHRSKN